MDEIVELIKKQVEKHNKEVNKKFHELNESGYLDVFSLGGKTYIAIEKDKFLEFISMVRDQTADLLFEIARKKGSDYEDA